jgi:archaellum component FlaC
MADALEKLDEEQLNAFYKFLNDTYDDLSLINDKAINDHIAKYDASIKELDEEINIASLALSEAVKKKIGFIKEAYTTLLTDL